MQLVKNDIVGVGVTNASKEEVLEFCLQKINTNSEKYYITTPNPEIIVAAHQQKPFKSILNNAAVALCDGVGVAWAGTILGKPFKERVTGVDFVESFCEKSAKKLITVGFLGGKTGIALKTAECLQKKYSGLRVVLSEAGNPDEKTVSFVNERIRAYFADGNNAIGLENEIKYGEKVEEGEKGEKGEKAPVIQYDADIQPQSAQVSTDYRLQSTAISKESLSAVDGRRSTVAPKLDMLFVAFGFPKQETWIAEHLDQLNVKAAMGVGGTFDYISGEVARAPKIIRALGFEWLYRLIRQPWRWKRQLALVEFMLLVLKERLRAASIRQ